MCVLCGYLVTDLHWTEARFDQDEVGSAAQGGPRRRSRIARIRIVDRILDHYGLDLHDDWGATSYVVSNRKGASQLVEHLGQLWPVAERLAGRRLDPLDEELLEDLVDG
jgi:hypothetical protein